MIDIVSDPVVHRSIYQPLAWLLYVGPDQALPVLSFLAASIGFLLMWWRRIVTLLRRALKSIVAKPQSSAKTSELKRSSTAD